MGIKSLWAMAIVMVTSGSSGVMDIRGVLGGAG
jgi:hypothetical protein